MYVAPGRTGLRIDADPQQYSSHFTHSGTRVWPETNCYLDLWIETLHALGLDPVPSLSCALSADHDGMQWTFLKQQPEDLRRLYGLEVGEDIQWLPLLETVETAPVRGILHTVEVDSWWLPDTAGTAYRHDHVKTSIVPTRVDRDERVLWYIHNAGLYELGGEDFEGLFRVSAGSETALPPYIEQITYHPDRIETDAEIVVLRGHLTRRAAGNPVERLADGLREALRWLPEAGIDRFHQWAFATLRQCGATAEVAADVAVYADQLFAGAALAEAPFRTVAASAKSVEFKMARAAMGRHVNVDGILDDMARAWQSGIDAMVAAAG